MLACYAARLVDAIGPKRRFGAARQASSPVFFAAPGTPYRGELVDEMERRGVAIPSADKQRYVGTILWRQAQKFEHVGDGYWLRGRALPNFSLLPPTS
jgi:hypothetical protein